MDMKEIVLLIISGFFGTLGFSFFFRMTKKKIIWAALGGALTCVIYVIVCRFTDAIFFQNAIPALTATVYSEILARITKSPATPYITLSIVPLIPGGKLYYTTYYFVVGERELFKSSLSDTFKIAAGLAVGIIIISVIIREINARKFQVVYEDED